MKFFELNVGPEYFLHLKYGATSACLFIAVTFGFAFPILYIIAVLALIVQYIIERCTLIYYYRIPNKMSNKLNLLNLSIL